MIPICYAAVGLVAHPDAGTIASIRRPRRAIVERSEGLKVTTPFLGGSALAAVAVVIAAHLSGSSASIVPMPFG